MNEPVLKLGEHDIVIFWCEPCDKVHAIRVGVQGWAWNMSDDKPTFHPSINVLPYPGWQVQCHSFVNDGRISYLSDCGHDKAGQELDLLPVVDWPI